MVDTNKIVQQQRRIESIRDALRQHPKKNKEAIEAFVDVANEIAWDDAIHIAAPWESRSSLCGNWNRNLVSLNAPRPDGGEGCWTCLTAAEWLDKSHRQADRLTEMHEHQRGLTAALKAAAAVLYTLPRSAQSKRRKEVLAQVNRALRGTEQRQRTPDGILEDLALILYIPDPIDYQKSICKTCGKPAGAHYCKPREEARHRLAERVHAALESEKKEKQ